MARAVQDRPGGFTFLSASPSHEEIVAAEIALRGNGDVVLCVGLSALEFMRFATHLRASNPGWLAGRLVRLKVVNNHSATASQAFLGVTLVVPLPGAKRYC
jgi:hypothetical protein